MLLDSASLYFRAFHGVPPITAPDGTPVNAVRGFLDMCATLVAARAPTDLVACWDDQWRPRWRVALVPTYKAHRAGVDGAEDVPADLAVQVPIIADVLAALGIARVGHPDHEADDVIATLAKRHAARGVPVEIVTADKDLLQLVDDERSIRVLSTVRGVRRPEVVDAQAVHSAHGVVPAQYADFAVLRGDPSDGLPGVPGVGARTAADLLARFADLDGVLSAAERGDPALRPAVGRALRESRQYVLRAARVVRVVDDLPLPELPTAVPAVPADQKGLEALASTWGLTGSVDRLVAALARG